MKLIYLRRLTTLLAFLDAVFKPAGIIHPEPPRNDDRHTKSPVLVSVYDIDLCEPLKKCPDTDEKRYWRKLCFSSSCQADEVYHCGVDEDLGTIVEFCYPRFPCDKGKCPLILYILIHVYTVISAANMYLMFKAAISIQL